MFSFLIDAGLAPGTAAFWVVLVLLTALGVAGLSWRRASVRAEALGRSLEGTRLKLAGAEQRAAEAERLEADLDEERRLRAAAENVSAAQEARLEEREKALAAMQARLDAEFKATTADLLKGAHESFLNNAKQTFDLYKQTASAEGEQRRKALDDLLKPVGETLKRYERGLADMREEQAQARGAFKNQFEELARQTLDVRDTAKNLATALRAGPKTRGRWGEEQLKNVVEIAGMMAHVDFTEQTAHADGDKRKIPDMVVSLPGQRVIAVDSKVSLGAYLDAVEADSDEARNAALNRHADDLWAHVKGLSAKDYAASLRDSLDYVVLFLPGENFFAAALDVRPELYQKAFDQKILIATPTILIAVLKSAALNWRQEKMNENAHKVSELAKDLYKAMQTMGGHLSRVGGALGKAVDSYNGLVGSVEATVMPKARKFMELDVPGANEALKETDPVEKSVRELRAGKDLRLEFDAGEKDDAA